MPTLPPGTAAVRGAVRERLGQQIKAGALAAGDLVLVACSGGADSLALAAATAFVAPRLDLRAGAVSVDHGLQPGSAQVAESAADQCAGLGLDPALVRRAGQPPPAGRGPEAAARTLRYEVLEQTAESTGATAVLLGHTADDQAETVLLALARGSGTRSLAGMDPVRGLYLRPLLGVRRAQTEAACADAGLDVWHDPANAAAGPWRTADGRPLPRAAVREQVLPVLTEALGAEVIGALGRTAELARADADLLDDLAADLYDRARRPATTTERAADRSVAHGPVDTVPRPGRARQVDPGGLAEGSPAVVGPGEVTEDLPHPGAAGSSAVVVLSVAELAESPTALRTRVLRRAALEVGSPAGALSATHVRAMAALVSHWRGQGPIHLPGGIRAARRYGNLVLGTCAGSPAADRPGNDDQPDEPGGARGRQHDG